MDDKKLETSWANVDVTQRAAMAKLDEEEDAKAKERVKEAVQRLQRQRILDQNGRRIRTSTPPDMQDGSQN